MPCTFIPIDARWKACTCCGQRVTLNAPEPIRHACGGLLRQPAAAIGKRTAPCQYRGSEQRTEQCETCQGNVRIKVFGCCKHVACTVAQPMPGLAICAACPDYVATVPLQPATASSLLFRFAHGLGDRIQFMVVLRHLQRLRPDLAVDVECDGSTLALYRGLCRRACARAGRPVTDGTASLTAGGTRSVYDIEHLVDWPEPDQTYPDSPSTKAEKHLREVHHIAPIPELCRYQFDPAEWAIDRARRYLTEVAGSPERAVLIHHQGSSYRSKKNLPDYVVRTLVRGLTAAGYQPVLLDWQGTSTLRDDPEIACPGAGHDLWGGQCYADPDVLCAVASLAGLSVGIDSGPGMMFAASGGPTLIVWTLHHPVNYSAANPNVLHLVHNDHAETMRGDPATGLRYFDEHYRHKLYAGLGTDLRDAALEILGALGSEKQPIAQEGTQQPRGCDPIESGPLAQTAPAERNGQRATLPVSAVRPADRTYSVADFGGWGRALHFCLPAGIGDISWVYSKICGLRDLTGREVILSVAGHDRPRRGGDFVRLLPGVHWGGYLDDRGSNGVLAQPALYTWQSWIDKPWVQNLSANRHLEGGHPLAEWMPQLPTDYHYDLAIPPADQDAAAEIMARLPSRVVAVYVSNRDRDQCREGGWSLWPSEAWVEFLWAVAAAMPDIGFVFLGAEWDRDKTEIVASAVEKSGLPVERVIARPLGIALECLRRSSCFFAYPSGIGILANVLRVPGVMLLPASLRAMERCFADPADIDAGRYRAWPDPQPGEVLRWFRNNVKNFLDSAAARQ